MTDYVKAWRCIGCGRIEAPQTCVGVCSDRKVELVYAADHLEALASVRAQTTALAALARKLARTTPRGGEWERSFLALQNEARRLLATLPDAV